MCQPCSFSRLPHFFFLFSTFQSLSILMFLSYSSFFAPPCSPAALIQGKWVDLVWKGDYRGHTPLYFLRLSFCTCQSCGTLCQNWQTPSLLPLTHTLHAWKFNCHSPTSHEGIRWFSTRHLQIKESRLQGGQRGRGGSEECRVGVPSSKSLHRFGGI